MIQKTSFNQASDDLLESVAAEAANFDGYVAAVGREKFESRVFANMDATDGRITSGALCPFTGVPLIYEIIRYSGTEMLFPVITSFVEKGVGPDNILDDAIFRPGTVRPGSGLDFMIRAFFAYKSYERTYPRRKLEYYCADTDVPSDILVRYAYAHFTDLIFIGKYGMHKLPRLSSLDGFRKKLRGWFSDNTRHLMNITPPLAGVSEKDLSSQTVERCRHAVDAWEAAPAKSEAEYVARCTAAIMSRGLPDIHYEMSRDYIDTVYSGGVCSLQWYAVATAMLYLGIPGDLNRIEPIFDDPKLFDLDTACFERNPRQTEPYLVYSFLCGLLAKSGKFMEECLPVYDMVMTGVGKFALTAQQDEEAEDLFLRYMVTGEKYNLAEFAATERLITLH